MIETTITTRGGGRAMADTLNQAVANVMRDIINDWHHDTVPKHFTEDAFGMGWGYTPRMGQDQPAFLYSDSKYARRGKNGARIVQNSSYYWAKWRRFHTHSPLVKSGASEAAALSSILVKTQTSKRSSLVTTRGVFGGLPSYFYKYRTDTANPGGPINKAAELTAVNDVEQADFTKRIGAAMPKNLDELAGDIEETVTFR
jgi:hypothetical protein